MDRTPIRRSDAEHEPTYGTDNVTHEIIKRCPPVGIGPMVKLLPPEYAKPPIRRGEDKSPEAVMGRVMERQAGALRKLGEL